MNIAELAVRARVLLATGNRAEVLTVDDQAETVCIRYLDALGEPELVDTEAWISADEIIAIDTGAHIEGSTYAISNDDFA
jgi:hypothetical protein